MTHPDPEGLSPSEKRELLKQLLAKKNNRYDIYSRIRGQIKLKPDRIAIIDDRKKMTYGELGDKVDSVCHYLESRVKPGDKVGLYMEPSVHLIISLLACLKGRYTFVPLDPGLSGGQVGKLCRIYNIPLVIVLSRTETNITDYPGITVCIDDLMNAYNTGVQSRAGDENMMTDDFICCGFLRNNASIDIPASLVAMRLKWLTETFGLSDEDTVLFSSNPATENIFRHAVWPLVCGVCVAVKREREFETAEDILNVISRFRISIATLNSFQLKQLEQSVSGGNRHLIDSLVNVFHAGVNESDTERPFATVNYYSFPEIAGEAVFSVVPANSSPGRPQLFAEAYQPVSILDQKRNPVPGAAIGELCIGAGPEIMTGIIARFNFEKKIEIFPERSRNVIFTGGFRIDAIEIENCLLQETSVRECVVFSRYDIEKRELIIAYVAVPDKGEIKKIREIISEKLPYYMVPHAIVPVSGIPLMDNGEIDFTVLENICVLDEFVMEKLSGRLEKEFAFSKFAVAVGEIHFSVPALHISDLLPSGTTALTHHDHGSPEASETVAGCKGKIKTAQRISVAGNDVSVNYDNYPSTLQDVLFAAAAAASADGAKGIRYIDNDSDSFQSYRELLVESGKALKGLRNRGIKPGTKIVFQFSSNKDFVEMFWACVTGGYIPVPMALCPVYTAKNNETEKLVNVMRLLEDAYIICGSSNCHDVSRIKETYGSFDMEILSFDGIKADEPDTRLHKSDPEDPAVILFTSGSTGIPKGVVLSHHNIIKRSIGTQLMNSLGPDDVSLNWMPLDHVGGLVMFHVRDVFLKCRQLLVKKEIILGDPLAWLDMIDTYRVTATWAPNFAFGLINSFENEIRSRAWDLSPVKFILNGGEAVVARTARKFLTLLRPFGLSSSCMKPAYGMSETSSGITYTHDFNPDTTSDDDAFVSVGRPIAGIHLRIVDDGKNPVEEKRIGFLEVKGVTVTSGYFKNPALNRESFTDDGWFITGDMGFLDNGKLTITGRAKDVIIINGINYFCHEIESIADQIAGVEPSFTAACAIRYSGMETDALVVFFNCQSGDMQKIILVIESIRQNIVNRTGVSPAYIIPVNKEEVPKTTIGKIQRKKLAELFESGQFNERLKTIDLYLENENTLPDWFWEPVWQKKALYGRIEPERGDVFLIFSDRSGLGERIIEHLTSFGCTCIRITAGSSFIKEDDYAYTIHPFEAEQYDSLIHSLNERNIRIKTILHLWTYDRSESGIGKTGDLEKAQYYGTYSLFFLTRAINNNFTGNNSLKLFVISSQAQLFDDLSCDVSLDYEKSAMPGLLKSIGLEMPSITCRHIDLEISDKEENPALVVREIMSAIKDREIVYRDRIRYSRTLNRPVFSANNKKESLIRRNGLYLVTGGLGGIGSLIIKHLGRTDHLQFIIIGRTHLPEPAQWPDLLREETKTAELIRNYMEIKEAGIEFEYYAMDITDTRGLKALVDKETKKRSKELAGIFHLAGVGNLKEHWSDIDSHWIKNERLETFENNFKAKVTGTWSLYTLLEGRKDAMFVAFSSVAGVFGSASYSAYAAANSFLDTYTLYRRRTQNPLSFCIDWSMWENIGMSKNVTTVTSESGFSFTEDSAERNGYYRIRRSNGITSMLACLFSGKPQVIAGINGCHENIRFYANNHEHALESIDIFYVPGRENESAAHIEIFDRFNNVCPVKFYKADYIPADENGVVDMDKLYRMRIGKAEEKPAVKGPSNDIEYVMIGIWEKVLKRDDIPANGNFFEAGGNSLLATQLITQINKVFMINTPLKEIFENPVVSGLCNAMVKYEGKKGQLEAVARFQRKINAMSDEEVRNLLSDKGK